MRRHFVVHADAEVRLNCASPFPLRQCTAALPCFLSPLHAFTRCPLLSAFAYYNILPASILHSTFSIFHFFFFWCFLSLSLSLCYVNIIRSLDQERKYAAASGHWLREGAGQCKGCSWKENWEVAWNVAGKTDSQCSISHTEKETQRHTHTEVSAVVCVCLCAIAAQ